MEMLLLALDLVVRVCLTVFFGPELLSRIFGKFSSLRNSTILRRPGFIFRLQTYLSKAGKCSAAVLLEGAATYVGHT
jgi:hypothetical protein